MRQRGQAILEFAILTPIIFAFIFIIVDFGIGLARHMILTNAVREGARYAAAGAPADSGCSQPTIVERVTCKTLAHAQGLIDSSNCPGPSCPVQVFFVDRGDPPNGQLEPGDSVAVHITYSYKLITALGLSNSIGYLHWPGIPPLKMNSCSDFSLGQVTNDATISTVNPPCD